MAEEKYEVARFDKNCVLKEVCEVEQSDHVTDPKRRQMKLPPDHDVRSMIDMYRAPPDYARLVSIGDRLTLDPFSWYHSRALASWAVIEDGLFRIFWGLLHAEDKRAAAIYYSHMHFNQKLKITDALANVVFQGEEAVRWRTLRKQLWESSNRRNNIAHYGETWISAAGTAGQRVLIPSIYSTEKLPNGEQQKAVYVKEELEKTLRSFLKLHGELVSFANDLGYAQPTPHRLVEVIEQVRAAVGAD